MNSKNEKLEFLNHICLLKTFISCFILVLALKTMPLDAANFHAIIVGDLDAYDLKPAIKNDLQSIQAEVQEITKYTGLTLKEKVFSGETARAELLLSYIKTLKVHKKDMVLFYFSGHGYRTPSMGTSPWPSLLFAFEGQGINADTLLKRLKAKKPRFLLMLTDCCNNVLPDHFAPPILIAKSFSSLTKKNYQKLFLKTWGTLVIASSEAGETSLATTKGSIYTAEFLQALHEEVKKPVSLSGWQNILDNASNETTTRAEKGSREQHPIFMFLKKHCWL